MNRLSFIQIQERMRDMQLLVVTGREQMTPEQREDLADELTTLAQLVRPEDSPAPLATEGELTIAAAARSMGGQGTTKAERAAAHAFWARFGGVRFDPN